MSLWKQSEQEIAFKLENNFGDARRCGTCQYFDEDTLEMVLARRCDPDTDDSGSCQLIGPNSFVQPLNCCGKWEAVHVQA